MSKAWFQGTADAVRQYMWLFEDAVRDGIEDFLILAGAGPGSCAALPPGPHRWPANRAMYIGGVGGKWLEVCTAACAGLVGTGGCCMLQGRHRGAFRA